MDANQLRAILSNPAASPAQKEAARAALAALGEIPATLAANSPADPEMEAMVMLFGPEVTALVEFAGVKRLRDVTLDAAMQYAAQLPKESESGSFGEDSLRALRGWHTFRFPDATQELWQRIKNTYPEPERRAEFDRVIAAHPYLSYNDSHRRHDFQHLVGFCETRDVYDTRTYFLPRVVAVLAAIPEYAFKLRNEVQAFIAKQEERCSLTTPTQ